jgi:hypothetical protein
MLLNECLGKRMASYMERDLSMGARVLIKFVARAIPDSYYECFQATT